MDKPLSFIEHLEEFRKRVIYSLIFIILFSCLAYALSEKILVHISKPVGKLVFTSPYEVFLAYIKISLFAGLFISVPFIAYHFWKFVSIALDKAERKYLILFGPASILFFAVGAAFAYFGVIPVAIRFFLSFQSQEIVPMITVNSYVAFVGTLMLVFGIVFELPLAVMFITKLGFVTPRTLAVKRRYAIVLIFIAAAILTPPDVVSQMLMAVPLVALYEISIILSRLVYRPKPKSYID